MGKKVLSILLCLMMAVALMPVNALAIDTKTTSKETAKDADGREYYTKIVLNPYTFYDVAGGSKKSLDDKTLTNLVKNDLITPWSYVAMGCFKDAGDCATIDNYRFDEAFFNDKPSDDCFGNVRKVLTGENADKGKVSRDNLWGTGVKVSDSLSEVRQEMADQIVKQIDHAGCIASDVLAQGPEITDSSDTDYKKKCVLPEMKNSTDKQKVIYSIATSINEKSWNRYKYNSFGIAFYDFHPRPIQAEDLVYKGAADGYDSIEEAKKKGVPGVVFDTTTDSKHGLAAKNESSLPVSQSLKYSNGHVVTVTNSVTNTSQYTIGTAINYNTQWGEQAKVCAAISSSVSETLGLQFTFNQMYGKSTTDTKSESHPENTEVNQSVTMEPQTAVMLTTSRSNTTMSEDYDTPVMLSYKVALFTITGDVYADNGVTGGGSYSTAGYKHGFYYNVIGGSDDETGISANENLHFRVVDNQETKRNDAKSGAVVHRYYKNNGGSDYNTFNVGTNWHSGLFVDKNEKVADNLKKMTEKIPMLSCGCNYSISCDSIQNIIGELVPLYLPRKITLTKGDGDYQLGIGDRLNLSKQLAVACLNKNEIPYFGFSPTDGKWVSCDEKGNPTVNEAFSLGNNGAGDQVVTASKAGTGYVTWKLKDNITYQSEDESGSVTAKSNLPAPIIEIRVNGTAFQGKIEVSGEFDGCVGDSNINLNDSLKTVCYDKTGKQTKAHILWEQRELDGISVDEDGGIVMNKAGNYNVRALVKNTAAGAEDIYSDWYPITVKEERKLTKVEFDKSMAAGGTAVIEEPANTTQTYNLKSFLKAYDQYGDPWKGNLDDVSFVLYHNEEENAHVIGSILRITGECDFEVHPIIQGQSAFNANESEPLRFVVVDNLKCGNKKISLKAGESQIIKVTDYENRPLNGHLTFISGNPEVATVSEDGTVTAVGEGYADIWVRDGVGGLEKCEVFVTAGTDNPDKPDSVEPKANPVKVRGKNVKIKYAKLSKKTQIIKPGKAIIIKDAQGRMKYRLSAVKKRKKSFKKYFKINPNNGKIAVKKGLKKGVYKVKVKVRAAGNKAYKPSTVKTVIFKIKVK